ncbi:hypothetical protein [Rhodococcus sp. ACS1]|uniref:hypothetical protein n=1 Tax=Rhodococcus sp. ACS1 TaxID=2028570 RepID=UPI00211C6A0C|nr:hypothetical protein [Rhodococcus sp. ACS1]
MSPKRGERVAPPAAGELWELRFATSDAAKGWDELCRQAPANTLVAYEEMRRRTVAGESTTRHHRLKGKLATGVHGVEMGQWQYEVTAGDMTAPARQNAALHYLRAVLVRIEILPDRLEPLGRLEPWLDTVLETLPSQQLSLIKPYAQWSVLRRARRRAIRRRYTDHSAAIGRSRP